jgi:hypothetical protein
MNNSKITIKNLHGLPYLSILHDKQLVQIQLHQYDNDKNAPYFVMLDKRCIPELIEALKAENT